MSIEKTVVKIRYVLLFYLQAYLLRGVKVWSIIMVEEARVYSFIGHVKLKMDLFSRKYRKIFYVHSPSAQPRRQTVQLH